MPRVRLVLTPSQDIWWEKFPLSRPLQSINKSTHYELMGKHEVASQGESMRADIWKMAFAAESRADHSGNVSACDTLAACDKCDMHVNRDTQVDNRHVYSENGHTTPWLAHAWWSHVDSSGLTHTGGGGRWVLWYMSKFTQKDLGRVNSCW